MKRVAHVSHLLPIFLALAVVGSTRLSFPHHNVFAQVPEVGSVIVIVRAKDAVETPLANADVAVNRGAKLVKRAKWDPVYYYVARGLTPGRYTVTVNAPGYKSRSKNTTIKIYETVRVEIDLPLTAPSDRRSR